MTHGSDIEGYGDIRRVSAADGGTPLTVDPTIIPIFDGAGRIMLIPRNFASGAAVVQVKKCPYLVVYRTTNDFGAIGSRWSHTQPVQDGLNNTLMQLHNFVNGASGGRIVVGAESQFRGLDVTIQSPNTTDPTTLTVEYWDGDSWVDVGGSLNDGTSSGGISLGQSGQITWTVPSGWSQEYLSTIVGPHDDYTNERLWLVRLSFSAQLSSPVSVRNIYALGTDDPAEFPSDFVFEDEFFRGVGGWSAIEARTNVGTANLIVNAGLRRVYDQWR